MSADWLTKFIPHRSNVQYIPPAEVLTPEILANARHELLASHTHHNGRFRDGGPPQFLLDANRYKAFRERFYSKIIYRDFPVSKKYPDQIAADTQHATSKACSVLSDIFPVGKYVDDLSIIDESCIFYCNGEEIACYDRDIRSPETSAKCCKVFLEMSEPLPPPKKNLKRHPMGPATIATTTEEAEHILLSTLQPGARYLCWSWFPKVPSQGPVISSDLHAPEMSKYWSGGPLLSALRPLFLQGSAVVHARHSKKYSRCCQAVRIASGKLGSNGMSLAPLTVIPFNGCGIVSLADTKNHRDKNNMPGEYGVTQPLGEYPPGEGVMTLVQLGVVLLYRPTDTLAADFYNINHFTSPLKQGYRYCLTSFIHRSIYQFHETREKEDLQKRQRQDWKSDRTAKRLKAAGKDHDKEEAIDSLFVEQQARS